MRKLLIVVSSLLLVVSLVGCARTVTNVNFGSTMTVTVTLGGVVDATNNRYFMVLSDSQNFKVSLPPPSENPHYYEFLEPDGTQPKDGTSLEVYYTNFFSTWSGYIKLDTGQYYYAAGPFVQGTSPVLNPFAIFGGATNKLVFDLQLNRIFPAGVPTTVYFDVIAVPWASGAPTYAADHLNATTNSYISTQSGSIITVQDTLDYSTPANPSLDILTCEVTVQ